MVQLRVQLLVKIDRNDNNESECHENSNTLLPPSATKQRTLPKKTFSTIGIEIVFFVTFVAEMRKLISDF